MNCREIEEELHLLVGPPAPGDAAAPAALRAAAEAHLAGCARCRRLVALARGEDAKNEEETGEAGAAPEGLIAGILRKTTGAPSICASVADRLCAWVDGGLSRVDSDLVAEHVGHCRECERLVAVLRTLSAELPLMAEVEPDVRFVIDVLDRTSRRKVDAFDPLALLGRAWERMIRRPRIAQEFAYCAAMILFLVFGTHARDAAPTRSQGASISARTADDLARGADLLSGIFVRAGADLTAGSPPAIPPEARPVLDGIRRTRARLATTLDLSWTCAQRIGDGLLHWDTIAIWSAVRDLRDGIHRCWREKDASPSRADLLRSTEPCHAAARIPRQMMQARDSKAGADSGAGVASRGEE